MQYQLQSQSSAHSAKHRRVAAAPSRASVFVSPGKTRRTPRRVSMFHLAILFFLLLAMLAMAGRPAFPGPSGGARPVTAVAVDAPGGSLSGN